MLIAAVFFGGLFLRLESFLWPVRAVSYALPVTYGIQTLQNVMLRGNALYPELEALAGLGLASAAVAIWLLKREFQRGQQVGA